MRIKIISDGTTLGTRLVNAETGESIDGATSITWSANIDDGSVVALVRFIRLPIDAIGEAELLNADSDQ